MANLKNTTINDFGFLKLPVGTTVQRPTSAPGQLRYNSTTGRPEYYNGIASSWVDIQSRGVRASGGTVYDTDVNGTTYRVHVFTSTGNSTFTVSRGGSVEYLIVAGGGGGGRHHGGGGGGGGLLTGSTTVINQSYTVTVGSSGVPTPGTNGTPGGSGGNGGNSIAFGFTAIGGGGGGNYNSSGSAGGSGGGSNNWSGGQLGGSGTLGQGNNGSSNNGTVNYGGGGGGGGSPGGGLLPSITNFNNGGIGIGNRITGELLYYAGGGAAGTYPGFDRATGENTGGFGGGGNGGLGPHGSGTPGKAGTPNTGGGGGATAALDSLGGSGGSGIVIIRYPLQAEPDTTASKVAGNALVLDLDFSNPLVYIDSTVISDGRLNGTTGTLINGPVFTDAKTHRSSFRFNGNNNYILLSNLEPNRPTTEITVASWVYPRRAPSTGTIRGAAVSGDPNHYLGIIDSQDGGVTHGVHWALQTSITRPGSFIGNVPRFSWSYIVGTYDGSRMKAYINGVQVYDVALTGTISGDGRWMIGAYLPSPTDVTHNWDGEISTASIYSRALTQQEITNNFNATRWRFGV